MSDALSDAEIEALMAAHGLPEGRVVVRTDADDEPVARCLEAKRGEQHRTVPLPPSMAIDEATAVAAIRVLRRNFSLSK